MDNMSYDSLLHKTKSSLIDNDQIGKVSFPSHFTSLLEDCQLCVKNSLEFVTNMLLEENTKLAKLSQYMQDAVDLLQLLSGLIKTVVETITMSCCTFKTFPTTTGHIILLVFTHCKNSESLYGDHLSNVQKQLKDLFRTCHELQLTYLMVLEKHFIFDLTAGAQLDILIEALNINLEIGEIVQALDIKTMAEQWKAYMAMCEKYSTYLLDKHIFYECTQLLCAMVTNNLKKATETDQEDKVVLRSMKVANFTVKILIKMCNIFKHATVRDKPHIVDMLIDVYLCNPAYLESIERRPPQYSNAMSTNILNPSEILLKELIMDEKFMNNLLLCNTIDLQKNQLLGYVFLIISIAKCTLQDNDKLTRYPKDKLLHCIFKLLPQCHIWLNIGMKFKNEPYEQSIGLFEYILIHAIALSLTMNCEEMRNLEEMMYEALLGTECVRALFASNLWTGIARISDNRQYLFSQVVSLSHIYQKLESNKCFQYSPQWFHIANTLRSLFESMRPEYRLRVYKQFNPIEDRNNVSLWSVLKIRNLPKELQRNVKDNFIERYKNVSTSNRLSEETIYEMIQLLKLLATCSYSAEDAECLVVAWGRACPEGHHVSPVLEPGMLCYVQYVQALVEWTTADVFSDESANLEKVLHVISNIVKINNTELNLLLIDLLCDLAIIPVHDNNNQAASFVKVSFRTILQSSTDSLVRNKLLRSISKHDNQRLEIIFCSINQEYQETWNSYKNHSKSNNNFEKLKEVLLRTHNSKFTHKCLERQDSEENSQVDHVQKSGSNFDFADIDALFDTESESEPANKKIKLDSSEAETILNRLENDTALLCDVKENVFTSEHRIRIKTMYERLKSLFK